MPASKPLILVALEFEAQFLSRTLRRLDPTLAFTVHIIGPRAAHLPAEVAGISIIILAGLSGALDPALRAGDVIIDDRSSLPAAHSSSLPPRGIYTADRIVATPQQKRQLHEFTKGAAVDMESKIVRAWAQQNAVPYLGIRAIADTADESLDPALAGLVDDTGRTRPAAAVAALIKRPGLLRHLLHVRRTSRIALDRLSDELIKILRGSSDAAH